MTQKKYLLIAIVYLYSKLPFDAIDFSLILNTSKVTVINQTVKVFVADAIF